VHTGRCDLEIEALQVVPVAPVAQVDLLGGEVVLLEAVVGRHRLGVVQRLCHARPHL